MKEKNQEAQNQVKEEKVADQIWNHIKTLPLNVFGIQGQTVEKFFQKVDTTTEELTLKSKVFGVFPALENLFTYDEFGQRYNPPKYTLEVTEDQYVVVKKSTQTSKNKKGYDLTELAKLREEKK